MPEGQLPQPAAPPGYLSLLLHAHLPFVRHPEHDDFLEEDWLFEAVVETYLPLLDVLSRVADRVPIPRIAMSLTPPLASMLEDPLLQDRCVRYLERQIALAKREVDRTQQQPGLHEVARFYLDRLSFLLEEYTGRWKRDIVGAFRGLQDAGVVEIIACAATHGLLPLLQGTPETVRAQILIGCAEYKRAFGRQPLGIWLPECAYTSALDAPLREAGLRWFVLDAHGLLLGKPRPRSGIFAPVFTPGGMAAFARDRDSSRQVWSAEEGYPGDPVYRDFYRDIGFDLSLEYLKEHLPGGFRRFTGLKYHRITGRTRDKQVYNRAAALEKARAHAADFLEKRIQQVRLLAPALGTPPLLLSPFDAELFGHWWYEGPEFLEALLSGISERSGDLQCVTPSDYLKLYPRHQISAPSPSSWGNKGYWEVWLDESNSWIYPHLHQAGREMVAAARHHRDCARPHEERYLKQMARELLLAQSSDWAFLIKTGTASDYATRRTKDHLERFQALRRELDSGAPSSDLLTTCETRDNLFPDLDWRAYL